MLRSILNKASSQCFSLLSSTRKSVLPVTRIQNYCKSTDEKYEGISAAGRSGSDEQIEFIPETTFPNKHSGSLLIKGTPYNQLPIIHIKATPNNTIISATDYKGVVLTSESCGTAGFRNVKKGTTIAAQATAIALAQKLARNTGIRIARVSVKGLGPGRMASMKGLQMAGMTIISITDSTKIAHSGNKPRRPRRI